MTVGIVGLGLMGGSLSLALQQVYSDIDIIGYDHNNQHCIEALEKKLVNRVVDELSALHSVDLLLLSVPVGGIIALLDELTNLSSDTTIIDLGSTKAKIVAAVPPAIRANFVAAHPMTGTEKFGPTAAIHDLYHGKAVVLCNVEESGEKHVTLAKKIFGDIGMKIFYMDAKEHDRHAAYISHMPHALSYALANAVMRQEDPESIIALAGGGFRDMSRIAKSSPTMWTDIFSQNRTSLLQGIHCFSEELERCRALIAEERWDELHSWMEEANSLHDIL